MDTDPYAPRISNVRDQIGFDFGSRQAVNQRIVTYWVGKNGPFTLTYDAAQFDPTKVQADMMANAAKLKQLGATS